MSKSISTIEEYIQSVDADKQPLLNELRQLILKHAPEGTTETINYGMPTFRYNGNLIHFALFKNHLGLSPGTEAIEEFSPLLSGYKTSKGAVQLPLDKPLFIIPYCIIRLFRNITHLRLLLPLIYISSLPSQDQLSF